MKIDTWISSAQWGISAQSRTINYQFLCAALDGNPTFSSQLLFHSNLGGKRLWPPAVQRALLGRDDKTNIYDFSPKPSELPLHNLLSLSQHLK